MRGVWAAEAVDMTLSLSAKKLFEVTQLMFETLALQHGAIDPDSGHIVCHQYRVGVTVAETAKGPVPVFTVEGCIYVIAGRENVDAVLGENGVEQLDSIRIRDGGLEAGGIRFDGYWSLVALSFIREAGGLSKLYRVDARIDGREEKLLGLLYEHHDAAPTLILVPRRCGEERQRQPGTHM